MKMKIIRIILSIIPLLILLALYALIIELSKDKPNVEPVQLPNPTYKFAYIEKGEKWQERKTS